jgi:hypothetical protein
MLPGFRPLDRPRKNAIIAPQTTDARMAKATKGKRIAVATTIAAA